VPTCNTDSLANIPVPFLKDAICALANVLGGDARKFLVAHGHGDSQLAVRALLGAHAEVNQVLPVERGQQERRRHGKFGEPLVGLALGI